MFDPLTYFTALTNSLKLTKDKYLFTKVEGLNGLEGIISNIKKSSYFVAVDISEDGSITQGEGGGYFNRRPTTIFITGACKDIEKKELLLIECRSIFKSFLSKLIKDKNDEVISFVNLESTRYFEIPSQFAAGQAGIYFMISNDEPVRLVYEESEWE